MIGQLFPSVRWWHVFSAIVALALTFVSARSAAIGLFASGMPSQALVLDASNPIALMRRIDNDIGDGGLNVPPKANWRPDAVASLRRQPINPSALRTLGFVAASQGNQIQARSLILLSQRLSRRDGLAQLWLVQDSAKRDDAKGALAHMDIALSVRATLGPIIYPMLLQVIEDPRYAREFANLVVSDRPWLLGFLTFANTDNPNPAALANVVGFVGRLPPGVDFRAQETNILWSLANAGQLDRAAKLVVELRRATPATLADGRFLQATIDPKLGPFAWSPSVEADVSSAFEPGGILRATMTSGKGSIILQRYFALSDGPYVLTAKARSDIEDVDANIGVTVECTSTTYALINNVTATVSSKGGRVGNAFRVPPNCPLQLVRFTARSADSRTEGALMLSDIRLEKQK